MISCAILLCWLSAGFLYAGAANAYFQRKYPILATEASTTSLQALLLISGPVSFFVIFSLGFMKYGWKVPFTKFTAAEWDKYTSAEDKILFRNTRPEE